MPSDTCRILCVQCASAVAQPEKEEGEEINMVTPTEENKESDGN